ncbi:hypothetical protein [Geothrix sp. 21YS21S-4]|uniref:hypothetical protein n=1 Tax=Geothrix sp. 21YS21S-4 TaxID=3068889 RepID=UPI0027BB13C4|nr:hypothetical protein [Geothrix sp. 21YS21S-4]
MPLYRAFLQALGAVGLAAMTLACGGKNKDTGETATSATLAGTVTYQRVPLATDANGVPIGLVDASVAANLKTLPARGVAVQVYQQLEQTQADGTKALVWTWVTKTSTDSNGQYSFTVAKGNPTMVEVLSSFNGGDNILFNLVAEPAGINSTTPVLDRLRYAMRKAADGTAPATTNAPSSVVTTSAVVNFDIGLNDTWWLVDSSYRLSTKEAPAVTQAVLETSISGRTVGQGSGSRILGIGDTLATFVTAYGAATPGTNVDLHYWPGRSEPKGSYIEYDRSLFPQALDPTTSKLHYFGSLRGGADNDDAWDEGVILPLLARNHLYAGDLYYGTADRTYSIPLNPLAPASALLTDLTPGQARIEGLADAMAANLLKSPYLADTHGTGLATPVQDIRDLSGLGTAQLSPYSAPAIRAFAWELILKSNSLTSPGTATTWANINVAAAARFFHASGSLTNGATDATARDTEPLNIYSQLIRLKEGKTTADAVDLATIFTDATLTTLTAPFGIPWPRPTTGAYASFVADWGTDPNSITAPLAPVVLSMAKAVQVHGVYPNLSQGEVFYAGFSLSADKRYVLQATITPALAAGAEVEVALPQLGRSFTFTGSGGSTGALNLPVNNTAPFYHAVRVRLKSPSAVQPDVAVTLGFTPSL